MFSQGRSAACLWLLPYVLSSAHLFLLAELLQTLLDALLPGAASSTVTLGSPEQGANETTMVFVDLTPPLAVGETGGHSTNLLLVTLGKCHSC